MTISDIFDVEGLVRQVGTWLILLIPIVAGVMMAYHYMMKSAAQDEQQAAQHTRSIRTIAISAGLGVAALAIINWIISFVNPGTSTF